MKHPLKMKDALSEILPFACPESNVEQFHWVIPSSSVKGEGENIFSTHFILLHS